jgi:ABC-type transport system involved in multi-copper enzyme maturation permease subunit
VDKLCVIALTAFQETLRRRVFYIVLVLAVLIVAMISSQLFYIGLARHAGETEMLNSLRVATARSALGIWNTAAVFLALFLGAIGVSSEVGAQTIVHVMSRPVQRWTYLLGRWLGLLLFLCLFLTVGVAAGFLVLLWLKVSFTPLLWLALAEMYIAVTLYSGIALALGAFMPPVLAGAAAFLLAILPALLREAIRHPSALVHLPALLGYYLAPARMPADLLGLSFEKSQLHSQHWLYTRVLTENLLYAFALLVIANAVFRRREIRVR